MSWNGTVRCGHCYKSGHNKRGCPELKKKIAADPSCWEAQYGAGKARQCSYCDKPGHNRKTCPPRKTHEALYRSDNKLWRQAFQKWAIAEGLGYGALISAPINWRDAKNNSHDGKAKPALGMFVAHNTEDEGNSLTYLWAAYPSHRDYYALTMELIGGHINEYSNSARRESLQLPDIPVISPASGLDHWGTKRTRDSGDARWTVVSPSPRPGFGDEFTQSPAIDQLVKDYFKAGTDAKTERDFRMLDTKVRKALKDYVNDSATLDELHARLNPADDNNSEAQTE
jgi:hypothetical protein